MAAPSGGAAQQRLLYSLVARGQTVLAEYRHAGAGAPGEGQAVRAGGTCLLCLFFFAMPPKRPIPPSCCRLPCSYAERRCVHCSPHPLTARHTPACLLPQLRYRQRECYRGAHLGEAAPGGHVSPRPPANRCVLLYMESNARTGGLIDASHGTAEAT